MTGRIPGGHSPGPPGPRPRDEGPQATGGFRGVAPPDQHWPQASGGFQGGRPPRPDGIGTAAELHAAATALTGLADFGEDNYRDGLGVLLESYARDAGLTAKGVRVARAMDEARNTTASATSSGSGSLRRSVVAAASS